MLRRAMPRGVAGASGVLVGDLGGRDEAELVGLADVSSGPSALSSLSVARGARAAVAGHSRATTAVSGPRSYPDSVSGVTELLLTELRCNDAFLVGPADDASRAVDDLVPVVDGVSGVDSDYAPLLAEVVMAARASVRCCDSGVPLCCRLLFPCILRVLWRAWRRRRL
jgi:hypothetical protein